LPRASGVKHVGVLLSQLRPVRALRARDHRQTPGDTKAGFEWAARYVLNFLRASLKGDAAGHAFLNRRAEAHGGPPGLLTVNKLAALTPPPNLAELKAMVRREGIQRVAALYHQLRAADP
jgi:hypothetical protein